MTGQGLGITVSEADSSQEWAKSRITWKDRGVLTAITIVVAGFVSLWELDRLIGMVPAGGYAASMTEVRTFRPAWPDALSRPWLTLHQADEAADKFIQAYLAVDSVMAVVYGLLLCWWTFRVYDRDVFGRRPAVAGRFWWQSFRGRVLLCVPAVGAATADVVENRLLCVLTRADAELPMSLWVARSALIATTTKWALLVWAVVILVWAVVGSVAGRAWLRRRGAALFEQRFSVLAVLPILGIGLISGPGIFDQLPDVQRSWFEVDRPPGSLPGPWHATVSVVVLLLVSFALLVLSRLTTDMVLLCANAPDVENPHRTPLWTWWFWPAVLGVVAVLAQWAGADVRWWQLIVFCAVPLLVWAVSWGLRRWAADALRRPSFAPRNWVEPVLVHRVGDAVVLAGVVAACLALVRSHTALALLDPANPLQPWVPLIGLTFAVATWWIGPSFISGLARLRGLRKVLVPGWGVRMGPAPHEDRQGPTPRWQALLGKAAGGLTGERLGTWWACFGMSVASAVVLMVLAVFPADVAAIAGVLGVTMLTLGALVVLVGAMVIQHAFYAPPEVFWFRPLSVRQTPVATMLVLVVGALALVGSNPAVYGLNGTGGMASTTTIVPTRSTIGGSVDAWDERTKGRPECTVTIDGKRVRPLVLVAAEGGGIRAAYWTTATLEELGNSTTGCGLASVVVASGVSGGSVGLAVARFTEPTGEKVATNAVWALGGADGLGAALLGLLIRDPVNSLLGIPAPNGTEDGWADRAALMEQKWQDEDAAPGLRAPFHDPPTEGVGQFAADLILNSAAVSSGCRVLISHVDLSQRMNGTAATCADPNAPMPFSQDLTTEYFRADLQDSQSDTATNAQAADAQERCLSDLTAVTAAMASARFPYVTPSGLVGPCGHAPRAQLIDGGYAEGSGLGTLVDLAPHILREAARHGDDKLPVQPVFVFLDNGRKAGAPAPSPTTVPEILVPLTGYLKARPTQAAADAWLQRAHQLPTDGITVQAPLVFVAGQGTEPAVGAPLGWVLSNASKEDMDSSLQRAKDKATACRGTDVDPDTVKPDPGVPGVDAYPDLSDLFTLLSC